MTNAAGLSSVIAHHIRTTQWNDLPAETIEVTKRAAIDAIGVMAAASTLGEGCDAFAELAKASGDNGPSTVLGWGFGTSPVMAAFANGAMAHALDFEDTHDATLVHPHAATVPAALAVAESIGGVSGRDFITAIALGADLSCRLALGLTESVEQRGFYFIPMLGAYGAAATAAKLLGLTEDEIVQSLALASCQAVYSDALTSYPPSHLRAVRDGFGAKAGVIAALLARGGLQAFDRPLEGPGGLYANYADGKFDQARMLRDIGRVFEGARVSFKPWPSCRGTHAFVEAALALTREHSIEVPDIEWIRVKVSPFFKVLCEPAAQKRRPKTAIEAKFSIPFTAAIALTNRGVALGDFAPENLASPTVQALADRVEHAIEPAWGLAESTRGGLSIRLADGRTYSREVHEPLGHPNNPMSTKASEQKFLDCLAHAHHPLAARAAEALAAHLGALEEIPDIGDLFRHQRTRDQSTA